MHARRRIRDAFTERLTDKVQAFQGRVFAGRLGALSEDAELPVCLVDVNRSKGVFFNEQTGALERTYLVEVVVVDSGPDPDIRGDELAVADVLDEHCLAVERALPREDALEGGLGIPVIELAFDNDAVTAKSAAGTGLSHVALQYLVTVLQEDAEPILDA